MAMILAFVLAYWSANLALRPLTRISHLIDDITRRQSAGAQLGSAEDRSGA